MSEHFNGLTPAEAERLAMLIEECGEVIHIAAKVLRHGYDNYHPDNPAVSNRDLLAFEIADFDAVVREMKSGELTDYACTDAIGNRWRKKLRFAHHQDEGC